MFQPKTIGYIQNKIDTDIYQQHMPDGWIINKCQSDCQDQQQSHYTISGSHRYYTRSDRSPALSRMQAIGFSIANIIQTIYRPSDQTVNNKSNQCGAQTSPVTQLPAKNIGRKINTFLSHCWGRASEIISFTILLVYFTQQIYNIIQNSTKYTPIVFPNTQRRSE